MKRKKEPNWQFTGETMEYTFMDRKFTLHRIEAAKDIVFGVVSPYITHFPSVKFKNDGQRLLSYIPKGTKGGWIEREWNLNKYSPVWVDEEAKVFGNSHIDGRGMIGDNAVVYESTLRTWGGKCLFVVYENAVLRCGVNVNLEKYNHISSDFMYDEIRFVAMGSTDVRGNVTFRNTTELNGRAKIVTNQKLEIRSKCVMNENASCSIDLGFIAAGGLFYINNNASLRCESLRTKPISHILLTERAKVDMSILIHEALSESSYGEITVKDDAQLLGGGVIKGHLFLDKAKVIKTRIDKTINSPINIHYIANECPVFYGEFQSLQIAFNHERVKSNLIHDDEFTNNLRHYSNISFGVTCDFDNGNFAMLRIDKDNQIVPFVTDDAEKMIAALEDDINNLKLERENNELTERSCNPECFRGFDVSQLIEKNSRHQLIWIQYLSAIECKENAIKIIRGLAAQQ